MFAFMVVGNTPIQLLELILKPYVCLAILKIKQIDWFSNQWASILLQFNF